MRPSWTVLPLLYGSGLGVVASLFLIVYGILHLVKPDAERLRSYGLRFVGGGLLCLLPLVVTLTCSSRLPIAF